MIASPVGTSSTLLACVKIARFAKRRFLSASGLAYQVASRREEKSGNHRSQRDETSSSDHASRPTRGTSRRADDDEINKPLGFELTKFDTEHPYLKERGLTADTILRFGIGFCASGSMAGRIVIPIHNVDGKVVAYAGRWPGNPPNDTPKYRLPAGFRKSVEVFNLHRAIEARDDQPLIIVEGFFDCIHLVQCGCDRTIALMGSTLSTVQEQLLRQHTTAETRIVLMLDEDEAGRAARAEIVQRLAIDRFLKIVQLPEHLAQPDQLSADELAELIGS